MDEAEIEIDKQTTEKEIFSDKFRRIFFFSFIFFIQYDYDRSVGYGRT